MAQKLQIYKCNQCGNVVEVVHGGAGQLVCCGDPMELLAEQTTEMAKEKHVPVIERIDGGFRVEVGSVPHPMVEEHHIEWIELLVNGNTYMRFLDAGDRPEAVFMIETDSEPTAREHCNVHGLWKG
jgi:superoxide reductase